MIQKILKHACEKSNVMSESDIPSKRYIMNWCLTRGYSVFTDGRIITYKIRTKFVILLNEHSVTKYYSMFAFFVIFV